MFADGTAPALICGAPLGLSRAQASVVVGIDAHAIDVQVCSSRGPAFFQMVGLAEAAVREARVRVAASLSTLGVLLDEYAITVNLAPADLRKSGTGIDLAIAIAVLGALGKVPLASFEELLLLGELGLDGALRPVRGVLPHLLGARSRSLCQAVVPRANAKEAGLARGMSVFCAHTLQEVVEHLRGGQPLARVGALDFKPLPNEVHADLADVRGQATAKRALEIAAAGGHNVLLMGPPGSGKTMLARILPSLLPPLSFEQAIECTAIHSVAGMLPPEQGIVQKWPFRAPHHSVSEAGLVGGGGEPRPGEVSLAHHGVLFLDELAEFRSQALEALRQPLEDGSVCIARARARAWFPARPLVVAAVNPCPCGYLGHPKRACRCNAAMRKRYWSRLSGPLLDRLDVHLMVPPVEVSALTSSLRAESSEVVRSRVLAARDVQSARAARLGLSGETNATIAAPELERVLELDAESKRLVAAAVERLGLSARAYGKVLRVARTIADLEGEEHVSLPHVAEAIQGRLLDRDPLDQS